MKIWDSSLKIHKLNVGHYACPEFESIKFWQIDEKVDGTNIRIIWEPADPFSPQFCGRTDNAQIPTRLLQHLQSVFTREKLEKHFGQSTKVVFFGEGYGPKIQACGSKYRSDHSFILFDTWIDGWWLEKHSVIECANQLDIEHTINQQVMTIPEIWEYVKSKPKSYIAEDQSLVMEGVIARSYPLMLFRQRKLPIMFKLKVKDIEDLNE